MTIVVADNPIIEPDTSTPDANEPVHSAPPSRHQRRAIQRAWRAKRREISKKERAKAKRDLKTKGELDTEGRRKTARYKRAVKELADASR